MDVGFVGLGRMGRPMAENLRRAGHRLTVHNRSRAAVDALVALGAGAADSPARVAAESDVLFTCLPGPDEVEAVYLGLQGALAGARPGTVFVDTSTVDPMTSRRVAAAVAARGVGYLDAPVSGGPGGAAAATLTIMVGGAAEAVVRARPVLAALGTTIVHLGPVGAGSVAKVVNQLITAVTQVLIAEAMVLGTKAGLDPRTLYEVLHATSAQSRTLDRALPQVILPRAFAPAFTLDGILKDLDCGLRTAEALGVGLALPPVARACYEEARRLGHGGRDFAAVILPMEARAGVEVKDRRTPPAGRL